MAHHVRGEFRSRSAAVLKAPQQLYFLAALAYADNTKVGFGVVLHIFEVLARARDYEYLAFKRACVEVHFVHAHKGYGADDFVQVKILRHFFLFKKIADVAAVALVPAKTIHIRCRFAHLAHERRFFYVFERAGEVFTRLFDIV